MINVAVVEDNNTIREGLKILIDGTKGYTCVATFSECKTMMGSIKDIIPDILLIDIGLPGISGIEGIRQAKEVLPNLTILVLTVYEENDLIFDALRAGASGYIAKKTPPSKLLDAIHEAYLGGTPMSSNIARKVIDLFPPKRQTNNYGNSGKTILTKREKEILNKLVEGSSFKAIADSISVNIETLRSDFKNIYKKIHLNSGKQSAAMQLNKN
jgi:DNA-binding NarL/FixJ family response regulator